MTNDETQSIKPERVALTGVAQPQGASATADAAPGQPAGQRVPAARLPGGALMAVGGAVASLALYVVFFVLPNAVQVAAPATPIPAGASVDAARIAADQATPAPAPYASASDDAKREFARDVLAAIVKSQGELEQLRVDLWGADEFALAQDIATEGDAAFALGQLDKARDRYEHALAQLQALRRKADVLTAEQLQQAEAAIDAGEVRPARTALALLASMYPDDAEVQALQQRFDVMPRVMTLIEDADLALRNGELEAARQGYREALQLDPARTPLQSALAEVEAQLAERAYRVAMSRGFTAVGRGEFELAERAFDEAARLRPDSQELAEGRRQLANARTLARIAEYRRAAEAHEAAEDWAAAVAAYDAALAVDDTLAFALQGKRRAQAWSSVEADMRRILADPAQLSDQDAYRQAVDVYSRAARLDGAGERIHAMLDELEHVLQVAAVPVPVVFMSDNATDVVVFKVARLGQFDRRQLELRPGRYTVVGSRPGFRDVRHEIVVTADMPPIEIRCVESLAAAL